MALSDPETVFIVVPYGARRRQGGFELVGRILVEWRLPPGASPRWLERWPPPDLGFEVTLAYESNEVSKAVIRPASSAGSTVASQSRAGASARLAVDKTALRTIGIDRAVSQWVEGVLNQIDAPQDKSTPKPTNDSPIRAFVRDFSSSAAGNKATLDSDDFISSRIATRYPEAAVDLGLAWEFVFTIADPEQVLGRSLLARCQPTGSLPSAVVTPFTRCIVRDYGQFVSWYPEVGSASTGATERGFEGIIRMLPHDEQMPKQPKWFLESSEYVAAVLHQNSDGPGEANRLTKALGETGGLALGCEGIAALFDASPPGYVGNVPVLAWREMFVGFRVDAKVDGDWRSLVLREVSSATNDKDEGCLEYGAVVTPSQTAWQFEEIARWDGGSLIRPSVEQVGEQSFKVSSRVHPQARLRWKSEYAFGMRPVFKGGWSNSIEEGSFLRNRMGRLSETSLTVFDREEALKSPEVELADMESKELFCSLDGHGIEERHRLRISPPRVGVALVKRSGKLDLHSDAADQGRLLHRAASTYPDPDLTKFPDPWASELECEVTLLGGNVKVVSAPVISGLRSPLQPGTTVLVVAKWRQPRDWPAWKPVQLEIEAADEDSISFNDSFIHLRLARGAVARVVLRCGHGGEVIAHTKRLRAAAVKKRGASEEGDAAISRLAADRTEMIARHIVRTPSMSPESAKVEVARDLGRSDAVLVDLVRADRRTTSVIVAELEWIDVDVVGGKRTQQKKRLRTPPLYVAAGEPADFGTNEEWAGFVAARIALPLPDSRRRELTLRFVAIPRHGERFKGGGLELSGRTVNVLAKNAQVPSAPLVTIIEPLVQTAAEERRDWDHVRTWGRTHRGNLIRVYLGCDWGETGVPELLGIVCAPDSLVRQSDGLRRELKTRYSQWGAEVLIATPAVQDGPYARHFVRRVVTLDGVDGVDSKDLKAPSVIAGHDVQFDPVRGEYFADLEVAGHDSPFAWLRMIVVRLQPDSISGALSSVGVLSQFSQLLPDRSLTVTEAPHDHGLLRFSASRTPAIASGEFSSLVCEISISIEATLGELGAEVPELVGNRLWTPVQTIQLLMAGSEASRWIGQARISAGGDLLVAVREFFVPVGDSPRILQWESRLVVNR